MKEIEVNEYVRTKDGIIDKVERFSVGCCVWHCENGMCIDECNCIGTHLEDIVKHSKQLIDLIEEGDIVNGYRVINVINEGPCPSGKCVDIDSSKDSIECTLWEEDIKTILTRESYMANCYKVGGEDE